MDTWQELTIEVKREAEEAASNILIELGSQGVAIDDSADYLGQVDQYGELFPEVEQSERVKITGYYPDSVDIEAIASQANERLAELDGFGLETGEIELTRQELAEEDWADNWKKYFEPARITHDLTIVRPGRSMKRQLVRRLSNWILVWLLGQVLIRRPR